VVPVADHTGSEHQKRDQRQRYRDDPKRLSQGVWDRFRPGDRLPASYTRCRTYVKRCSFRRPAKGYDSPHPSPGDSSVPWYQGKNTGFLQTVRSHFCT
jgi:hypothetical protein